MIDYILIYMILVLLVITVYLFGLVILSILKPIINKFGIDTKINLNKYEHLVLGLTLYQLIWLFIIFFEKYTGSNNSNFIIILYFCYFTFYLIDLFAVVFVLICFLEGKVRKKIALIWLCSIILFIASGIYSCIKYLPMSWLYL